MRKSRDLKYSKPKVKPNYADAINCSLQECNSIATNMVFDTLSVCPIHYATMFETWHNQNYEKLSKQIETMKDSYELALTQKDELLVLKLKEADEAYINLANELQEYMNEVAKNENILTKIKLWFTGVNSS